MANLGQTGRTLLRDALVESGGRASPPPPPPRSSLLQQRVSLWQNKIAEQEGKQHLNAFSASYDPSAVPHPDHNDPATYGRPVEGSLTDLRGKEASHWVDHEVDRLVFEIGKIGRLDEKGTGKAYCTFGELFAHYVDISNTVVGILMRARRRKRVHFEGEMLFQNQSENVVIRVL